MRRTSIRLPKVFARLGLIQAVLLVIASPMLGPRPVFAGLEAEPSEVIEQVGKLWTWARNRLGNSMRRSPSFLKTSRIR
jgi:hypothetical protein